MASSSLLIDGDFSQATEVGAPRYSFPFRQYGDPVSAFFEQDCWQLQATYSAQKLGIQHPTKRGFYLVGESDPAPIIGNLLQFTRTWSMIPQQQTVPLSTAITRPDPPTLATYDVYHDGLLALAGGGRLYSSSYLLDNSSGAYYDVFGTIKTTSASAPTPATSGTWIFTYRSSSVTLNWNDPYSTIQTAINGMASVVADGITVTVAGNLFTAGGGGVGITLTAGNWDAFPPSVNASGLGPAKAQIVDGFRSSASLWVFNTRNVLVVPSHGYSNTGQSIAVRSSYLFVVSSAYWSVYDSNTILVGAGQSGYGPSITAAAIYTRRYAPGASTGVRCVNTTNFYLPGVTPGIATSADIPVVANQSDIYSFLNAVFSNTGTINYSVGEIKPWMWPILSQVVVIINASDV